MRSFGILSRVLLGIGAIGAASALHARAGSAYAGVEAGPALRWNTHDFVLTSSFAQSPFVSPSGSSFYLGRLDASLWSAPPPITSASRTAYEPGYDVDAIGGYDFGHVRIEGEVSYRRTRAKRSTADSDFSGAILTALSPQGTFDPISGIPAVSPSLTFRLPVNAKIFSTMVNGLLEFEPKKGATIFAGPGIGVARIRALDQKEISWAWQAMAGLRIAVAPRIDLGLKYRYFRTRTVKLRTSAAPFTSELALSLPRTSDRVSQFTTVTFTRTGASAGSLDDRFISESLLLSLIYNFTPPARAAR